MTDEIRLSIKQRTRLIEIAQGRYHHAGICRSTTQYLAKAGMVEIRGERVAKTGRVMGMGYAYLTSEGRAWLNRHPGETQCLK